MRAHRILAAAAVLFACIMHGTEASADTSSWLSAGGGYGFARSDSRDYYDRAATVSFAVGVGTDPHGTVVVGGVVRTTTYLSLGTDLGVAARLATGGFARGQWGLALDLGPGYRAWRGGDDYGRFPLDALLLVGGPWGVQLGVGGEVWNLSGAPSARGAVALLEIDLLRLTVMRQGATDRWWENPSPAGGRAPKVP